MEKERYFIHFKGGLYKMLGIAQLLVYTYL